jgi:hypothetical protein
LLIFDSFLNLNRGFILLPGFGWREERPIFFDFQGFLNNSAGAGFENPVPAKYPAADGQ